MGELKLLAAVPGVPAHLAAHGDASYVAGWINLIQDIVTLHKKTRLGELAKPFKTF